MLALSKTGADMSGNERRSGFVKRAASAHRLVGLCSRNYSSARSSLHTESNTQKKSIDLQGKQESQDSSSVLDQLSNFSPSEFCYSNDILQHGVAVSLGVRVRYLLRTHHLLVGHLVRLYAAFPASPQIFRVQWCFCTAALVIPSAPSALDGCTNACYLLQVFVLVHEVVKEVRERIEGTSGLLVRWFIREKLALKKTDCMALNIIDRDDNVDEARYQLSKSRTLAQITAQLSSPLHDLMLTVDVTPRHIEPKLTQRIENKFYGPYNSILNECFPSTQFTTTPQYVTAGAQTGGTNAIGFAITYVIEPLDLDSPIFFVNIKSPTHLLSMSALRTRFEQLTDVVRMPNLYGVSAIGRQLSYYRYERASGVVKPDAKAGSTSSVVDTAPNGRWNTNIIQEESHVRFLTMVEEIKQIIRDLWGQFSRSWTQGRKGLTHPSAVQGLNSFTRSLNRTRTKADWKFRAAFTLDVITHLSQPDHNASFNSRSAVPTPVDDADIISPKERLRNYSCTDDTKQTCTPVAGPSTRK
ncbi:hypothetical protein BJY52DRAFT_1224393 [Lactarius psammicola]|nr:hypothetical protein BJY52DRAFT_1224393 [Lactarius psammicola]